MRTNHRIVFTWLSVLLSNMCFLGVGLSQENLVLNGTFEELNLIKFGPTFIDGQLYAVHRLDTSKFWALGLKEHDVCSKYVNGVGSDYCQGPNSIYSEKNARSGRVHAFIEYGCISKSGMTYFKDLYLQLREPLKSGNIYTFCAYAMAQSSDSSKFKIGLKPDNKIDLCEEEIDISKLNSNYYGVERIILAKEAEINIDLWEDNSVDYRQICATFEAEGGETVLRIGNLNRSLYVESKKVKIGRKKNKVYVQKCNKILIDDCSLICNNCLEESISSQGMDTVRAKTEFTEKYQKLELIGSIYFEVGKFNLRDYDQMVILESKLSQSFSANYNSYIAIGYADPTGSAYENEILSTNRANYVADRLALKFPKIKIDRFGLGECINESEGTDVCRRVDVFKVEE